MPGADRGGLAADGWFGQCQRVGLCDGIRQLARVVYAGRVHCPVAVFIPLGLYSRYWRYASVDEANQIVFAVAVSTVLIGLVFLGILKPFALVHKDFPRSLPLLDGILVLMAVGGSRFSVRLIERSRQRQQKQVVNRARVVIFGAGAAEHTHRPRDAGKSATGSRARWIYRQ